MRRLFLRSLRKSTKSACVLAILTVVNGHGVGPAESVERIGEFGILGRAGGVDDLKEGVGLRWWRLWVEVGEVEVRR